MKDGIVRMHSARGRHIIKLKHCNALRRRSLRVERSNEPATYDIGYERDTVDCDVTALQQHLQTGADGGQYLLLVLLHGTEACTPSPQWDRRATCIHYWILDGHVYTMEGWRHRSVYNNGRIQTYNGEHILEPETVYGCTSAWLLSFGRPIFIKTHHISLQRSKFLQFAVCYNGLFLD